MQQLIKPGANSWRVVPKLSALALGLGLLASLSGCAKEMIPVSVTGYNHMKDESIAGFSVNGGSGGNLAPESADEGGMCCVSIPERWRPGMKATVTWEYGYSSRDSGPPFPPQKVVVDIPEYTPENLGNVQVHFYSNHRIKVVVSRYGIRGPAYPMSSEDMLPWKVREDLIEYYKERGWK